MRSFPPDMSEVDTDLNYLTTHALLAYYEEGWDQWFY